MKPRTTVGEATAPDGSRLELIEHDGDYLILANRVPLMSTRLHESEEELARLACVELPAGARVLIGGLGMGFTLRAALDRLPEDGRAVVAELVPEVVEWNRGPLAEFTGRPLEDARTEVVLGDVARLVARSPKQFDAVMLDVDNGPSAASREPNSRLYSNAGLRTLRRSLRAGGRLTIWGARDEDRGFLGRMTGQGFEASKHRVPARPGRKGGFHVVYLGVVA